MRIGAIFDPDANAQYRVVDPLRAMERRGHDVVWPREPANPDARELAGCDVVHVHRFWGWPALRDLRQAGVPITYDNDDYFAAVPRQSRTYRAAGGEARLRQYFAASVKFARQAAAFTTTTDFLAERYRKAGVERVTVIENCLNPDLERPRARHKSCVIGWVAGAEHDADARALGIADVLERLLEEHKEVEVDCVGVDLSLPRRYRHVAHVPFAELPRRVARFDIGIAPLADAPFNAARSDIKLKEYAASGIAWVASPVGPYARLGPDQGGVLAPPDAWFEVLDRLVTQRRERKRLSRSGRRWARTQTIERAADRWETVFARAASA